MQNPMMPSGTSGEFQVSTAEPMYITPMLSDSSSEAAPTTVANTLRGRPSRLPVIAMIQYTTASAINSMPAMPTKDNGAMSTPWNKLIEYCGDESATNDAM